MDNSVLVLGVGPEQGLGVALCKKFAEEGYKVFGCGRSKENMEALKSITTSNGSIEGLVADVTSPEDFKYFFYIFSTGYIGHQSFNRTVRDGYGF